MVIEVIYNSRELLFSGDFGNLGLQPVFDIGCMKCLISQGNLNVEINVKKPAQLIPDLNILFNEYLSMVNISNFTLKQYISFNLPKCEQREKLLKSMNSCFNKLHKNSVKLYEKSGTNGIIDSYSISSDETIDWCNLKIRSEIRGAFETIIEVNISFKSIKYQSTQRFSELAQKEIVKRFKKIDKIICEIIKLPDFKIEMK